MPVCDYCENHSTVEVITPALKAIAMCNWCYAQARVMHIPAAVVFEPQKILSSLS